MEEAPEEITPEDIENQQEHLKNNEDLKDIEKDLDKETKINILEADRARMLIDVMRSEAVSNIGDLIPFLGGPKMMIESIAGETLSGEELTPKERIIHAGAGAASLGIDFLAVGELTKGAILLGRSVGMVEKLGAKLAERGAIEAAEIFTKTARVMLENPKITEKVEKFADTKIREFVKKGSEYREKGLENAA
jgi:hypothetical protein